MSFYVQSQTHSWNKMKVNVKTFWSLMNCDLLYLYCHLQAASPQQQLAIDESNLPGKTFDISPKIYFLHPKSIFSLSTTNVILIILPGTAHIGLCEKWQSIFIGHEWEEASILKILGYIKQANDHCLFYMHMPALEDPAFVWSHKLHN